MHKPAVPPRTKMVMDLPPASTTSSSLTHPSPGTQRVKPALAPKPCFPKLPSAMEPKSLGSKSQHHPHTVGRLNLKNGKLQENKKIDWDYIVPICLCSQKRCQCIKNTSIPRDKVGKDLKILQTSHTGESRKFLPTSLCDSDNNEERTDKQSQETSANPSPNTNLNQRVTLDKNTDFPASRPAGIVRPFLSHRTWSDESNGNVMPQSTPGQRQEEDTFGTEQMSSVSRPKPVWTTPRKPNPVPVPRKARATVVTSQDEVEEAREHTVRQEPREMNLQEVEVDRKSSSSVSVSVPVNDNKLPGLMSARKACSPPAPPPKKKPFLSVAEKLPTCTPPTPLKDVVEEDLDWDSSGFEMEVSVDKEEKEVEKVGRDDQEAPDLNFTHYTSSSSTLTQPELSKPPAIIVAAKENGVAKVAPKKPQRNISPMLKKQLSEEKVESLGDDEKRLPVKRELPSPPAQMTNRNISTPGNNKPSRPSLGKVRARSFSGADLVCSEGQRKDPFWKQLDLKLFVKNLKVKGSQNTDSSANEQSVDKEPDECQIYPGRKSSCPVIGVEQNVDGDEFSPGVEQDIYYETINFYENIPDLVSTEEPKAGSSLQPSHYEMYNDEGIYEEPYPTHYVR